MRKIRPAVIAFLLMAMVLSLTACGSKNTTQPTTGVSQSSGGATTAAPSDTRDQTGGTREGVVDGLMNDIEDGADAVKRGMNDMTNTAETNRAAETTKETSTAR